MKKKEGSWTGSGATGTITDTIRDAGTAGGDFPCYATSWGPSSAS